MALGESPVEYAKYFAEWKALGPAGECSDWFFGKDGFYKKPLRNRKMVPRHVHLPPKSGTEDARKWDRRAKNGDPKESNSALVYAEDRTHGYLLMFVALDPHGHKFADLQTSDSVELMGEFCDMAEAFIHDGTVPAGTL